MITTFSQIQVQLKKFKVKVISIDNLGFKFHYRATFLILLVCTVLVTSRQYIGEHIRCMTGGGPTIPEHVMNTFCFFTTTFTVVRHLNETLLQKGLAPHPGIGPIYPDDEIRHHAYYQWVPFVLFAQALSFYLPHLIWRSCEGGKIKSLVIGLQLVLLSKHLKSEEDLKLKNELVIFSKPTIEKKLKRIKSAFLQHIEVNRWWASKMICCELLNLANCCLQIYLTHLFLRRQFLTLGIDFINDDFKGNMDTLDIVFPKVTKCHFHKFGPSGSIQKHDGLCVMALNVINEKIYVFLWFWYGVLLFVSVLSIIWRLITLCLHSRSTAFNGLVFSMACPGKMNPWDMLVVTNEFFFSDWLFLYYLARNMEPYLFRQMLLEHIIPELQSEKNSAVIIRDDESDIDSEKARLKAAELEESDDDDEDLDKHSLDSNDMSVVPPSTLAAVNEKHVKFA